MRAPDGFSLVEVMVALSLFAIAVMALAALQAQLLAIQGRMSIARTLVSVAEEQLAAHTLDPTPGSHGCGGEPPAAVDTCLVRVVSCAATGACPVAGGGRLYRVTVRTTARDGQEFEISTLSSAFPP